ncbi:RBBP8 N-terminal-like protein [Onychostoma macrolepis]|nr:RBBP8 N-terminal-like protein [Onychostoma macrolepis]XP_058619896.1 RBBP8 N-terminal-like protein [Onychostoma macrolepis]XP_058619897.1 RBBP8 N-terminal-like protein [Onychostoma macrolepis]XP_058619898.1 RBBP8 N-terminal-like protein [Onychostoma macrolepis]XP_058619899.1 RBBP8 N-terminal-like protein [Onychostoma macrolepis]XP_058619901.1 RBBP8 N-terminal-like protein [Onychostoma macrolepis]XP_058619902.1 RBBP8 N-terminal-like protein [Onychostoma macrolepis]XP_058619903.1 RBBP8 N-te
MAVESFPELLQKLREVHEHELEGWQDKVLELTNKKNIDAKRIEELYNRNQQMKEQQRILTENIKQLENRLRAGLCDRCTVTQDVAKKRQQEYENSQLQSLQHISLLVSEMNSLKKENDRLREELKGLRDPSNRQNGHLEDAITPEVKVSPDTAVAAVTLLASGLKSSQPPPGDATVPAATVKREVLNSPPDSLEKASEHKLMQSWGRVFSFESNKPLLPTSRWGTDHSAERRSSSVDSVEHRHSPLSPLPSPLSLLKNNPIFSSVASEERSSRQQIHAPVPFRPLPIKTGRLSIPWSLSESTDWVTVAAGSSGVGSRIAVHPSQTPIPSTNILRFPKLVPPSSGHQSRTHGPTPNGLRPWSRRNLSEHAESREKRVAEAATAPPQWKVSAAQPERIFGQNLRVDEEEAPLDLSESGRSKSREKEKTHSQSDSSSSSPPPDTLSSSSQCPSSPQSDQQTADNTTQQEEAQETCKEQEEVKEGETSPAAETSVSSEKKKIPPLTISLQPVVVMETLKSGVGLQLSDHGSRPMEQEEKENNNLETSRKRLGQDTDGFSQRSLKEKKIRLSRGPQGNHADSEQG